ncbi:MAG: hypothetical protein E7208_08055 [Clostridium butyricum]|nr:hypothetical protein [Clostridium butyricum]
MTILKKNGGELTTKIDTTDLNKVKSAGVWFAEWNKDSNSYTVQNISSTAVNKKSKPLKQSLQNFVMDANVSSPIIHINKDTLDNRKSNLTLFNRNEKNETEKVDDNTIAILLKDKYGNVHSKALISAEDLNDVVTNEYVWVNHKLNGEQCVVANTPNGRVRLDTVIMGASENEKVHHINLNPLDNRKENLEIKGDSNLIEF